MKLFKKLFLEEFKYAKSEQEIVWKTVGEDTWMTSFNYNIETNSFDSEGTSDVYYITVQLLQNPKSFSSPLSEFDEAFPRIVKDEPYFWIDFESKDWGTATISKQERRRNAPAIIRKVISVVANKVPADANMCFTASSDQESRVSLYNALSKKFAEYFNKSADSHEFEGEVYFFIH
jgi:hypothetical protein